MSGGCHSGWENRCLPDAISAGVLNALGDNVVAFEKPLTLDDKLAAARERGWQDSGTWWNDLGQQMVTVNRFAVSVAEFMQRSLDSFDVVVEKSLAGLEMCRAQIEKIKARKAAKFF